nr:DUF6242 domain-containing protein [uncultured Porphyromonas sp.]
MSIRSRKPVWPISALLLLAVLLYSCNQGGGDYVRPIYTDYTVPGQVVLSFPKVDGKQLPTTRFSIDHINHRIYNTTPLPYGSELDSAYLQLVLSNQLKVSVRNVDSGKTVVWDQLGSDTTLISFKGGRMELTIQTDKKKDNQSVTYDFRVLTYGYDPNKLVWTDMSNGLPIPTEETRTVVLPGEKRYLLSRLGEETSLLEISTLDPLVIRPVAEAQLPKGLRPYTAYTSSGGDTWALDGAGHLFSSLDLVKWESRTPAGVTVTQLLSVRTGAVYLVGTEDGKSYSIYRLDKQSNAATKVESVRETFPIRDSYVHEYEIASTPHMLLFGGSLASGRPITTGFFSSDLVEWGALPSNVVYPSEGALYVTTTDRETLYRIGGVYEKGRQSTIFKSSDNGVTWTQMETEKAPGKDFLPISHAGGYYYESPTGESLFIFGGRVGHDGEPTRRVWRGTIDRSAGIINDFTRK